MTDPVLPYVWVWGNTPRLTESVEAERRSLIARGLIVPLEARMARVPVLRLLPGERERYEAAARS